MPGDVSRSRHKKDLDMSSPWLRSGRWLGVLVVFGVALGCGDPEPPAENDQQNDNSAQNDANQNDDPDAGQNDNDGEDTNGDDIDPDLGVDGADDNCPAIANADQADRSRDGIGDACANYPYFHDPSNPVSRDVIPEEEGGSNDNFFEARENWMLDTPYSVEGTIEDPGERDWYALEVDEPTTVMFHLEAPSETLWPALIIRGDDFTTQNTGFTTPVIADGEGESLVRDVHLPLPGIYVFQVSDFNNFTTTGSETGGSDYDYRVSVSTPPLPEGLPVSLPMPRQVVPYDSGEAQIFSLDASDEDALRIEATGAPQNQFSMLFPSIQVLDGDTGEVLAYTTESQVDTESMRNELTIKVGEHDNIDVLVEGHQVQGDNDIVVDIAGIDKPEHQKSVDDSRLLREDHLLWLRPGSEIDSMIGPPVPSTDTALEADEDRFLLYARPGDFIRVNADPHPDSQLDPELGLGRLSGLGNFIDWHLGFGASESERSSSVSALVNTDNLLDSVIQVTHAGNADSDLPVGGPEYSYELSVERLAIDDEAQDMGGDFPMTLPVTLDAGEQALYDFDFQPGHYYEMEYSGGAGQDVEFVDRHTGELYDSTTSSTSFMYRPDRNVVAGIRDDSGQPIVVDDEVELEVSEVDIAQEIDLDGVVEDSIEGEGEDEIYRFSASAGDVVEARVTSDTGPTPEIELSADIEATDVVHDDEPAMAAARVDSDTEMLAIVSNPTDIDSDYSLGVHSVDVDQPSAPAEATGQLDELRGAWWRFDVDEYQRYTVNATGQTELGDPLEYRVFDADTMEWVGSPQGPFGVFDARDIDEVYVAVIDPQGPLDSSTDFGVSVAPVEPTIYDDAQTVSFDDGLRPKVSAFDSDAAGLASLSAAEEQSAAVEFRDMSYRLLQRDDDTVASASGDSQRIRALMYPREADADSWSGEFAIDEILADEATPLDGDEAMPSEPMAIDELPAGFRGTVASGDGVRSFGAEFDAGDRISVFAVPAGETSRSDIDPWLDLVDPDGTVAASDDHRGEGNFPMLSQVEVDNSGDWEIDFGVDTGSGDFALYVIRH